MARMKLDPKDLTLDTLAAAVSMLEEEIERINDLHRSWTEVALRDRHIQAYERHIVQMTRQNDLEETRHELGKASTEATINLAQAINNLAAALREQK